jgi:hypothetical protein
MEIRRIALIFDTTLRPELAWVYCHRAIERFEADAPSDTISTPHVSPGNRPIALGVSWLRQENREVIPRLLLTRKAFVGSKAGRRNNSDNFVGLQPFLVLGPRRECRCWRLSRRS